MSTYQFSIDGSGAEAGAERIVKSFDAIRAAAGRMEGGVVASANKMTAAFRALSSVKGVTSEAVDRLRALSDAMGKFRGPSRTSVQNTVDLFSSLSKFSGLKLPAVGQLSNFLAVTNRYAGPTPQAGKNLSSLVNALNKFNGVTGAGARVTAFLNALGSYRGPSSNAGKNVTSLFSALSNFKGLPKGFASSSEAFVRFAAAVDKAAASMKGLREVSGFKINAPSTAGLNPRSVSGSASAVRGLTREYGFLESAVLRTHSALNALGGVLAAKYIINASNDLLKINAQLVAATGSTYQAATQFDYLQKISNKLGLDLRSTAESYGKFLGSVKGTKTDILDAQRIFDGFATAGRALQLSTDDMDGIFRALGQIMSKGKLQAEELRGQLGDRLPGAFSRMAAALGISTQELDAQMKKGLISGERLQKGLLTMADSLKLEFTPSAKEASQTVDAAFNRMKNAFTNAAGGLGKSGLNDGLIAIADSVTKLLQSDALATFLSGIGVAFKFVGDNANTFGTILSGVVVASTAKWISQLQGLTGLMGGVKDFFKNASSAFNTGYAKGTGLVGGGQSAANSAAGVSGQAAAGGMNAYAASASAAAVASAEEASAAEAAALSTDKAGKAATLAAGGFDAQATAAARSTAGLSLVAAENTAAKAAASGLTGTVKASVPELDKQAVRFASAGQAANSYGGVLGGLATTAKNTGSTISASWTNQIPSQARLAASTSQLAESLKNVGTTAAASAAPVVNMGTALGGAGAASAAAATGLTGLEAAAVTTGAASKGLAGSLGGVAVTGAEAAAATGVLAGTANGLSATGTATTTVIRGLAVAEGQAAGAAVAQAASTGALATAVGYASGALAVFKAALVTLPFVAVAVGVSALVGYISSLTSASEDARQRVNGLAGAQSTGRQIAADYADWADTASGALDSQTKALRENTLAVLENNLAKTTDATFNIKARKVKAGVEIDPQAYRNAAWTAVGGGGYAVPALPTNIKKRYYRNDGTVLGEGQDQLGTYVAGAILKLANSDNGILRYRGTPTNAKEYAQQRVAAGQLTRALNNNAVPKSQETEVRALLDYAHNVLDAQALKQNLGKNIGYDAATVDKTLEGVFRKKPKPDPNAPTKPGGGKNKGAATLNQDTQDLRRAMEGVRDLNREISSADEAIASLRSAGGTAVASEAASAAKAQLNNIEDAFNTADRARSGVIKFAAQLKHDAAATLDAVKQANATVEQAAADPKTVDPDKLKAATDLIGSLSREQLDSLEAIKSANVDTYESSRAEAEKFLTSLQQIKIERQKELDLAKQIFDINTDVASKTGGVIPGTQVNGVPRRGVDLVAATREGGRALQEATLRQEVLTAAVGVSADKYDDFVQRLYEARKAQQDLNQQLEIAAKLHDQAAERASLQDQLVQYQQGGNPRQIEAQLSINALQRDLVDKGYSTQQINDIIAQERELANLRDSVDKVKDSYEQLQQVSQDLSDAIVGGFRDAMDGTKSFGEALGDVFKQMKKIILDFVLFNPLKNFLQNALQGALGQMGNYTPPTATSSVASIISTNAGGAPAPAPTNVVGLATGLAQIATSVSNGVTTISGAVAPAIEQGFKFVSPADSVVRTTAGTSVVDANGITVPGYPGQKTSLASTALRFTQPDFLAPLKAIFTYRRKQTDANGNPDPTKPVITNFSRLKDGFSDIGAAFGKTTKGFGARLGKLGEGLGKVASVAGQAFAAFSIGKGLGDALGLGHVGSSVLGGAAAGFSVAGPIGAVVGGVAGLIGGLFSNKKPQARADVLVSGTGQVSAGNQYVKDKGDLKGVVSLAGQAGSLFQHVADSLDAQLSAGNYGTFGMSKKIKGDTKTFYSLTGQVDGKGRPTGTEGVDFIIASPDELAAFALKSQILKDKFTGLNPIYKTIAQNTTATTADALQTDLNVGKSYLDFVDQAKGYNQVEKSVNDLKKSYESLKRASAGLGISTDQLTKAYQHMQKVQKDDFNFSVSQGILGIKDPLMAEYNQLVKDYTDAVKSANAVGGDLTKVEEYFGLQRAQLIKKYMEQANNSIKNAAGDLLRQLTSTDASPLSAQTVFGNARDQYNSLTAQIMKGDFTNVDKLGQYGQDYLTAAQALYSSSSDFFSVFTQVTDFLKYVQANAPVGTGTDPNSLPDLPSLSVIQQQIIDSNKDLVDATNAGTNATVDVGQAILDGNSYLAAILKALQDRGINVTSLSQIPAGLLGERGSLSTMQKVG